MNIKDEIEETMNAYENNSYKILNQDGLTPTDVCALERAYGQLRDAYYEYINRELMANLPGYQELNNQAISEIRKIKDDINNLESYKKIIDGINNFVNLIGRLIISFGI